MDRKQMMDRISHLMNKTMANGATEEEASSALNAAQRLMDKYNIAAADLSGRTDAPEPMVEHTAFTSRWTEQSYIRALRVVKFMFPVEVYYIHQRSCGQMTGVDVRIFGDPVNVEGAAWVLNFLGPVFKRLWTDYRKTHITVEGDITNYYTGLGTGLIAKLKEDRAANAVIEEKSPGTGLAVIEKCLATIRNSVNEQFIAGVGKGCKAKNTRVSATSAYSQGRTDGRKINIARPIGGAGTRALTSK